MNHDLDYNFGRMKILYDNNIQLEKENKALKLERDKLIRTLLNVEQRCGRLIERINDIVSVNEMQ